MAGQRGVLSAVLPVAEAATACVGTALLVAAALGEPRTGRPLRAAPDRGHLVAAVRSERCLTVDDRPAGAVFAPLSRFWGTAPQTVPWGGASLGSPVASAAGGSPAALATTGVGGASGEAAAARARCVSRQRTMVAPAPNRAAA